MRPVLFFKLFNRAATAPAPTSPDEPSAAAGEPSASPAPPPSTEAANGAVVALVPAIGGALQAANSNVEAKAQPGKVEAKSDSDKSDSDKSDPDKAGADDAAAPGADSGDRDSAATTAASSAAAVETDMPAAGDLFAGFASTADLLAHDQPLGQERALADLARAAAVAGPGFHIAVVASPDLLAGAAIRGVLAEASTPRAADIADWVYVHNFDDASAPRALRLPAGTAAGFAAAVHDAVAEAQARLDAAFRSEDRVARRRSIDAETRDALDERLLAIKTRAEAQNLAVVRTPGGYVVAPVHEGKVVKPEVFARLPEAMRADVEARVRAMQDELAAALAERPAVERERRQRLAAADDDLARAAVSAAFDELEATPAGEAGLGDAGVAAYLAALGNDLVAAQLRRAEAAGLAGPATDDGGRDIPRRYRVNVFLSHPAASDATSGTRVVGVDKQAFASALVGHARRGERDPSRGADHLDLAPGAAHRAAGGVLYVDAGRLAHAPDGAAALEEALATAEIAIAGAAPMLSPQPIPLAARVVVAGDIDSLQHLARMAPGLLGRLRSTAHCDDTTERNRASEAALAGRLAAAVAEHGLHPLASSAVAALVDIAGRMAGEPGRLSCRIAPLIDIAREADVLARRDGRDLVTRADVDTAASARERSLAALGGALAPFAGHGARERSAAGSRSS